MREQIYLTEHPTPEELITIADKLRWHRIRLGLLQKEVAGYIGVDRHTYSNFETNVQTYYPLDKLTRIAELLDEYHLFIYKGQEEQLRVLRSRLGISLGTVKHWEQNRDRMLRSTYEQLIKPLL